MADDTGDSKYAGPVNDDDIVCEGYLKVRATKGIAGLRPWLSRYFILMNDFTLRRYNDADAVDNGSKAPRIYNLREVGYILHDTPPRFQLKMKKASEASDSDDIKFTAETVEHCMAWVRAMQGEMVRLKAVSSPESPMLLSGEGAGALPAMTIAPALGTRGSFRQSGIGAMRKPSTSNVKLSQPRSTAALKDSSSSTDSHAGLRLSTFKQKAVRSASDSEEETPRAKPHAANPYTMSPSDSVSQAKPGKANAKEQKRRSSSSSDSSEEERPIRNAAFRKVTEDPPCGPN